MNTQNDAGNTKVKLLGFGGAIHTLHDKPGPDVYALINSTPNIARNTTIAISMAIHNHVDGSASR